MNSLRRHTRHTFVARGALALAGLFALSSAQALELCINDVATLTAAMSTSQFLPQPVTVKLVQGTYALNADFVYLPAAPFTIEGGYTANCAARVVNGSNTKIDIGLGHLFEIRQPASSPEAQINIDGLVIKHSNQGVFLIAGVDGEGSIHVSRTRFTDMTSGGDTLRAEVYDGELTLENVVIDHLSTVDPGKCAVMMSHLDGSALRVNHMTADLQNGYNFCMDDGDDTGTASIYNSILSSSGAGAPIFVGASDADTLYTFINTIYSSQFVLGNTSIQGQLTSSPQWTNGPAGDYHLKASPLSPAINSATLVPPSGEPATDFEGNPRVIGGLPDRGAFESAFSTQSTLIVSNTLDSGDGSLRQALLDANSTPGIAKSIKFDIRGAGNVPMCPAVISLISKLPSIEAPINIDGYTQPFSSKNTDPNAFNANLCVYVKPASGVLATGFHVANSGNQAALTLRGIGLGGFTQPVLLLGGQGHVIAGNQFGGTPDGVFLPGAALNAISIGVNASGSLIVGGQNAADRNVIVDADFAGVNIQSSVNSTPANCQIVNNLVGILPNGVSPKPNSVGINVSGHGCTIARNRIAGNISSQLWLNGGASGNVVHQNIIGVLVGGGGLLNSAVGILVDGHDNVIGASGIGGQLTANTVRFMFEGGIVVDSAGAINNSINANLVYDNGATGEGMDIELRGVGDQPGPTLNDVGDVDSGANTLQNFPVPTKLVYNAVGNANVPATLSGVLDAPAGSYRIDAYFSNTFNANSQRGHAEIFLDRGSVISTGAAGGTTFTLPVTVPNRLSGRVISLTATNAAGNTSEIGTMIRVDDALFANGFD